VIPKIITLTVVLIMMALSFFPLHFGAFYILFRPLVQPYAEQHISLFAGLPLTSVFPILLIVYSTVVCAFRRGYTLLPPNIAPIYLLILLSALSLVRTMDYFASVGLILKMLTGVCMYTLMYNAIESKQHARLLVYSLIITSVTPMLIGYYEFFSGTGGKGLLDSTNRATGAVGPANMYGIFLVICFSACLMMVFQERRKGLRLFVGCILVSTVVSSLIALNRGTWIALSAALLFTVILYRRKVKVKWLVVAFVVIGVVFSGMIADRFAQLKETTPWGTTKNTFAGRVAMWEGIIKLFPTHPITGFGIGTAELVLEKHYQVSNVPHNDYLRLLLEVGLFGPVLYLAFLLRELCRNVKLVRDKTNWYINFPMLVAISYWVIISSTQNIIHAVHTFPMFMALIAVSRRWNELGRKDTISGETRNPKNS